MATRISDSDIKGQRNMFIQLEQGVCHPKGITVISCTQKGRKLWVFEKIGKFEAGKTLENCYYRQSIRDTIVVHDPLKCICLESYRPVIALPEDPSQKGTVFNSIYFLQSDGKMTNALGRKLLNYEVKNAPVKEQRLVDLTRDMAGLCCAGSGYQNIEPRENDPIRNWLGKEDKEVVLLRQQRADFEAIREWHAHFI